MITANWTEWVSSDAWRDADVSVIPAPPRAFAEVFALAAENDVDTRRLMRLVSNDPVFAIRILRLANVAAFAAAGEVMSISWPSFGSAPARAKCKPRGMPLRMGTGHRRTAGARSITSTPAAPPVGPTPRRAASQCCG